MVPPTLPTGWSIPYGFPGYPTIYKTMTFGLDASGSLASVIGFLPVLGVVMKVIL